MKKKLLTVLATLGVFSLTLMPVQAANTGFSSYDEEDSYTDYDDRHNDMYDGTQDEYATDEISLYDSNREVEDDVLDDDYYIDQYHVDIEVGEDNTFHITETLTYNFVQSHHGMTREIPLTHARRREDGSKSVIHAKVTNVVCSDNIAETSIENGMYTLHVGDKYTEIQGPKTYTLSYDYVMGKDPLKGADELYFNIVGPEWECPINDISWNIYMPKDFDDSTLGYSVGVLNSTGYNVDKIVSMTYDNTISGEYTDYLNAKEGITIRCTLPEGYFTYKVNYIPYIIVGIVLLLSTIMFILKGKDDRVIPVVSFEPPEGYTPVDTAYVMKGMTESSDFTAVLVYLADKGCIQIDEVDDKDFVLTKIKDYDGNNEVVRKYMDSLFLAGRTTVTVEDLKDEKFYTKVAECVYKEHECMKQKNLFYDTKWYAFLYFLGVVICSIVYSKLAGSMVYTFITVIVSIVFAGLLSAATSKNKTNLFGRIFIPFFLVAIFVPYMVLMPSFTSATLLDFIVCNVASIIIALYLFVGDKKTPEGNRIYGELLGFKNFIKKAESDKLRMLVEDDPEYYYHVLPYAYIFGLNNEWIKNFEDFHLEIPQPTWYHSTHAFDSRSFYSSFGSSMSSASTSPSSSGSGSSGGGFSGGGSGGGGGGAW